MNMEENDPNVTVCHMRLGGNGAKLIVDIAREKAYYSGTYNDGIAFLFACGIEDYDICDKILKGKLTLKSGEDEEGHEILETIDDDYEPPKQEVDTIKMKKDVEKYCIEVLGRPYSGVPAWRLMHSEREIAYIEGRVDLLREMAQYNPKKAYDEMVIFRDELIDETNDRALDRAGYFEAHEEALTEKELRRAEIVEEAKEHIEKYKSKQLRIALRAERHLDPCGDDGEDGCRYCQNGKCCFGGRNTKGCIMADTSLAMQIEASVAFARMIDDPEEAKKVLSKQFIFTYKGHEYTFNDSARAQSNCPHCGKESFSGHMIDPIEDDEAGTFRLIGIKQLSDDEYAVCYECQGCFEKFYYHAYGDLINTFLTVKPELESKIDRLPEV